MKKIILFFAILINVHSIALEPNSITINHEKISTSLNVIQKKEFDLIKKNFYNSKKTIDDRSYYFYHFDQMLDTDLILEDGSVWKIDWWYRSVPKNWEKKDRLKIIYSYLYNSFQIKNIDKEDTSVWGSLKEFPKNIENIARIPNGVNDPDAWRKVVLQSGYIFRLQSEEYLNGWKPGERIMVFHSSNSKDLFDLWNIDAQLTYFDFQLIGNETQHHNTFSIDKEILLNLEDNLNKRVIGQEQASQAVVLSLMKHAAGLKQKNTPIATFLFLGSTGVGKTELAKTLSQLLFGNMNHFCRFDMSHFQAPHALERLIGSPPGYVNHEEGGQLTNFLKDYPTSVILLDEFEKAHPSVQKVFLPVFDEGYLTDSKNQKFSCENVIFILTSNLEGQKIFSLSQYGYTPNEILEEIEETLIQCLSPELYNRVEPIVFHSITEESIEPILNLMLNDIIKNIKRERNIDLVLHNSVKDYLKFHGFHAQLGARPLKKLIDNKVVGTVSVAIIKENIPDGSMIFLSYDETNDSWLLDWGGSTSHYQKWGMRARTLLS